MVKLIQILFVSINLLSLGSCQSQAQSKLQKKNCALCDIKVVKDLDVNMQQPTSEQIYNFLCGFDESCSNNVEYSEYSNEILYKVIIAHPDKFIETLNNNNANLRSEYIYSMIATPLLDYDYDLIIKKLLNSKGDNVLKQKIISSVEKAKNSH